MTRHRYYDEKDRRQRQRYFSAGRMDAFFLYKQLGYAAFIKAAAWFMGPYHHVWRVPYDYKEGWRSMTIALVRRYESTEKARALEQAVGLYIEDWLSILVT